MNLRAASCGSFRVCRVEDRRGDQRADILACYTNAFALLRNAAALWTRI